MFVETTIRLSRGQYDALGRVFESIPSRRAVQAVVIETPETGPSDFIRVTYDAGWGSISFDIDSMGNSADVNFGESEISQNN